MRTLTTGCSFWLTSTTCRPLASLRISYGGNVTGRAGSGRGGFSRGQSTGLRLRDRSRRDRGAQDSVSDERGGATTASAAEQADGRRLCRHFSTPPRGMMRITSRPSGTKYFCATRLHVVQRHLQEGVELAVGRRHVLLDHFGVAELRRLLLDRQRG